ncbi:MAG: sigma-70 family RNA polymerase sigma factor [Planctomycetes bacterium]|nr:sigma-70 family RNA polymerase sigma factor [Planctomycetota bacterium]
MRCLQTCCSNELETVAAACRPFLVSMVYLKCHDLARFGPYAYEEPDSGRLTERILDSRPPVEEQAEREETWLEVAEALDRLPQLQQIVVTLRVIGGLSYKQIAQELDIPVGTVQSRLVRGRRELTKRLASLRNPG